MTARTRCPPVAVLRRLVEQDGLPLHKLAERHGVALKTAQRWLRTYGLDARPAVRTPIEPHHKGPRNPLTSERFSGNRLAMASHPKTRKCLRCRTEFTSEHAGHRLCRTCGRFASNYYGPMAAGVAG